jgi:hypothetical protein
MRVPFGINFFVNSPLPAPLMVDFFITSCFSSNAMAQCNFLLAIILSNILKPSLQFAYWLCRTIGYISPIFHLQKAG